MKSGSPILVATVGLPRSGKTTWAKSQTRPIVNPDSVRLAIHGQRFIAEAEPFVWATTKAMISALFHAGHEMVILDATNITKKRRDEFQSTKWKTYFKLFDTSKDECIRRAAATNDTEIISVIERMHATYQPLSAEELPW